ncbi:MAG TPA: YciI family protein [Haliangiales bacterium]|nr:YciI family protein [Haliangiales bacterium]
MAEFAYLYREVDKGPASPQEMQERLKNWTAWFQDLQAKGHIKQRGVPLTVGGATVKGRERQVHDGPYAESKDIVMGVTVVEARDLAQAIELARGCPVLDSGGLVEVRPVRQL